MNQPGGSIDTNTGKAGSGPLASWDDRLLFAPLDTLSVAHRRLAVVLAMAIAVLWSSLHNGDMMICWGLSDVNFYVAMAQNRYDHVPQPFSARPLAPLLARSLAAGLHTWTQGGFEVLAFASLLCTLWIVFTLLSRTAAPRWMLLAVAAVPFWAELLGNAGLPDPLYAALLSGLLLALARNRIWVAALLMLPLMVTRESTSLTLVCLLAVAWRRLRWAGSGLAVAAALLGSWIVRRLSAGNLGNPEHLSGAAYLTGKLVANTLRSVGIRPWSNVYPALCPAPAWQIPLHLGSIRAVGVCGWSPDLVAAAFWALLTVFGGLIACLVLAFLPGRGRPSLRALVRRVFRQEGNLLLRFCLLYGGVSLLLGPILGLSYTRLVGYGWPLLLVAVPALWARAQAHVLAVSGRGLYPGQHAREGTLLVLHLVICALGLSIAYPLTFWAVVGLQVALLGRLAGLGRSFAGPGERPGRRISAW